MQWKKAYSSVYCRPLNTFDGSVSSGVFSRSLTVCSGVCCYQPWLAELLQLCGVCSELFSAGLELS